MSVVQNTLIGRARQKIGGSVFSTWKGINVLKSKPLTVANPKTPGQIQQRSALTQTTALFRLLSGLINLGFKQQAVGKSEFNAFSSYNLKNAFNKAVEGVATLVPADLLLSQGTITPTAVDSVAPTIADGISIIWSIPGGLQPGQSTSDITEAAVYNVTRNEWLINTVPSTFIDEALTFPATPAGWVVGNSIRVYLFFYNASSRKSSDSRSIASVLTA